MPNNTPKPLGKTAPWAFYPPGEPAQAGRHARGLRKPQDFKRLRLPANGQQCAILFADSLSYHANVRQRLDQAWAVVKGKGRAAANAALGEVIKGIWRDIGNGNLKLYDNKNVWLPS